jgi:DNA polymerase III alpha subunit
MTENSNQGAKSKREFKLTPRPGVLTDQEVKQEHPEVGFADTAADENAAIISSMLESLRETSLRQTDVEALDAVKQLANAFNNRVNLESQRTRVEAQIQKNKQFIKDRTEQDDKMLDLLMQAKGMYTESNDGTTKN